MKGSKIFYLSLFFLSFKINAESFTADKVHIERPLTGGYRVIVWYTHLSIGEYRQAQIFFKKKEKAVDIFQKLVQGYSFSLGNIEKTLKPPTPLKQ